MATTKAFELAQLSANVTSTAGATEFTGLLGSNLGGASAKPLHVKGSEDTVGIFESSDFNSRVEIRDNFANAGDGVTTASVFIENRGGILNLKADTADVRANSRIEFTVDTTKWLQLNHLGQLSVIATTGSTSSTTGALAVAGGAGIAENLYVGGNIVISGDLTVEGTSVTLNTTDLNVEDKNITLNYHASNDTSASAGGAGITIQDAVDASNDASILWDATNDEFDFSHTVNVTGNIAVSGTVDGVDIAARDAVLTSTTTTAGAALPKAGGTMTGDLQLYKATPIITLQRSDNTTLPGLSWQGAGGTEAASIKLDGTSGATNTLIMSTFNGSGMAERLRLMTSAAGGITVTGTIVATGNILPSEDVRILDGKAARFGTDNDFSIYNDNSNTYLRNSTSNQDIIFLVNDDGAANTEVMRIDSSTNSVGIGTNAPSSLLNVHSSTAPKITISNGGGTSPNPELEFLRQSGVAARIVYEVANKDLVIKNDSTLGSIQFKQGNVIQVEIDGATGKVGIGTNITPVHRLDVDGAIATRQVRHSIRPSLNLDFANSKELDSRITFYRDSIATYYDSKGVLKYANINEPRFDHDPATGESKGLLIEDDRTNIFTYTNNPERWTLMSGGSSDPIANNIKSPDGTFNATSLIIAGSDPYFYQNNLTLSGTYTFSYWIKAVGTAIGKQYTTRITNVSTNSSTAGTLPSEWTRYTFTFTTGSTSTAYIGIEAPDNSPADGDEISIWGAQLELGAFATSLIPSDTRFTSRASTATYHDETGILRTAPVNGARHGYKYDGRKWVETGLILEEANTNRKQNFISSAGALQWSTNQSSEPVANYTVKSPDDSYGTIRQKINSTANAIHSIYEYSSVTAGTQLCFSVYAKAAEYDRIYMYSDGIVPTIGGVFYDLSNGTIGGLAAIARDAYGIEDVGNGWYRCWYSGTPTSGTTAYWHIDLAQSDSTRTFVGTVGQGLYLWGPQMEYSGALSSYIYTDTSAVTRAADVATSVAYTRDNDIVEMSDAEDVIGQQQGTVYTEWDTASSAFAGVFELWDSGTNGIDLRSNGTYYLDNNTSVAWGSAATANTFYKTALAYDTTSVLNTKTAANGTPGAANNTYTWQQYLTKIRFGSIDLNPAYTLNGHIKNFRLYQERLTDAEITALTENN